MNFTTKHVMPGLGVGCGWLCFALGSTCLGFRLDVLPILRERWRWIVACVVVAGKMHRKIQAFFIFTPIWGNDPVWLIFFKWVEITNQYMFLIYKTLEVVLFHNFVEWDCLVAVYMSLTHFHFSLVLGRGYTQEVTSPFQVPLPACHLANVTSWRYQTEFGTVPIVLPLGKGSEFQLNTPIAKKSNSNWIPPYVSGWTWTMWTTPG